MYLLQLPDVLGEEGIQAMLDDGAAGDQADEGILIIHYGHEILIGCPLDQIVHGGSDTDGKEIFLASAWRMSM